MSEVKTMSGPESDEGRGVYLPLQGFALGKGQRGLQSIPEAPSLWAESDRWKGGSQSAQSMPGVPQLEVLAPGPPFSRTLPGRPPSLAA